MKKINLLRLLPLSALILAACSTTSGPKTGASLTSPLWQAHQEKLKTITAYQTRGAFAYLSDKQKVYAHFFWQQNAPDSYRLLLTNPLGNTELAINARPGVVQITDNKNKQYVGNDAADMIQKMTGMSIPLNNLHLWILGLPGNAQDVKLDDQSRLKSLTYNDDGTLWQVNYLKYDERIQPALPSQLELIQGEQRIKLKMDNWTLNP